MFSKRAIRSIVSACMLLVAITGCDRYIDSEDPVRDLPTPPPTPINLSAVIDSTSATLKWEVIDTTAVRRFRIYTTDSLTNVTRLRDTTSNVAFSKLIAGLKVNQSYAFQVASVGAGGVEGYRSDPLIVRMQVMGITLDNNNEYTRDRDVSVQLIAPSGTTNVLLAEDPDFTGAQWQTFTANKSFRVSEGDGVKHVYARYLIAGGVETGSPFADSIILDTRAFIDSVYFTPIGGTIQTGTTMNFFVKTSEPGGDASVAFSGQTLRLFDDGTNGDITNGDGLYSYRYVVPLNVSANDAEVTGSFTDPAGNQAPRLVCGRLLTILTAPPDPVTLAATAAGDSIRISWSASTEDDFQSYRLYRQQGAGTVDENDQLISVIIAQTTTSFVDVLAGAGTWLYRIFVVDENNQSAGSNTVTIVK